MRVETIDRGFHTIPEDTALVLRIFHASLESSQCRISRLRVRLFRMGRDERVLCRVRAWLGRGATLITEATRATLEEACYGAAEELTRALGPMNAAAEIPHRFTRRNRAGSAPARQRGGRL